MFLSDIASKLADGAKIKGWKRYKSKNRTMLAFYHEGLGIVLKNPRFIMEHRTPLIIRVPTIKLNDGWVIQPIAVKTNLKEAVDTIKKQLNKHKGVFPDIHVGNVGWYNGKPLLFDW